MKFIIAAIILGIISFASVSCSANDAPDIVKGYNVSGYMDIPFEGTNLACTRVFKDGGFSFGICQDNRTDDFLCFGPFADERVYLGSLLTGWTNDCQKAADAMIKES